MDIKGFFKRLIDMAKRSVAELKGRFKRGCVPTEGDFGDVFDSYVHRDEGLVKVGVGDVAGLDDALNRKVGTGELADLRAELAELREGLETVNQGYMKRVADLEGMLEEVEREVVPGFDVVMASTSGAVETLGEGVVVFLSDRRVFARGVAGLPLMGWLWNEAVGGVAVARRRMFRCGAGLWLFDGHELVRVGE